MSHKKNIQKSHAVFTLSQNIAYTSRTPNDDLFTFVMMSVSCANRERLKMSTGVKARVDTWNKDLQLSGHLKETDKRILELAVRVDDYFKANPKVTRDGLRTYLDQLDGKVNIVDKGNFFTGIEDIIEKASKGQIKHGKNKKTYKPDSIVNWKKTLKTLQYFVEGDKANNEFEGHKDPNTNKLKYRMKTFSFGSINLEVYTDFVTWARNQTNRVKNEAKRRPYTENYIDCLIKDWKTLMNVSLSEEYHNNKIGTNPKFCRITEDIEENKIELKDHEIELLKKIPLTANQDEIRDGYLVNLYLGFRVGDYEKLTSYQNIKDGQIEIRSTEKTGSKASLPIHPEVQRILEKYNGEFPPHYHRTSINNGIRVIAKNAGITDLHTIIETRGGEKIVTEVPRWTLLTNHTGRRTAITYYLSMDIPIQLISKALGVSVKTIEKFYDKREAKKAGKQMGRMIEERMKATA